jgi:glucan endo-1,3-alpha-glucosidase
VKAQTGKDIHVAPNWQPAQDTKATSGVQGLFRSYPWVSESNQSVNDATETQDAGMSGNVVNGEQKIYLAPISPWCKSLNPFLSGPTDIHVVFTHFGKGVPWSKNLVFPGETLWHDRWEQILRHQADLQYVQIVSWNE